MPQVVATTELSKPTQLSEAEQAQWQHIVAGFGDQAQLPTCEAPAWIDADSIPELRAARAAGHLAAGDIHEARLQQLREGEFDAVPVPVDPLSTARRAREARELFGPQSEQYNRARQSLFTDCWRLLAEAWSKRKPEYFPEVEHTYDETTGEYHFMDRSLLDMVRDGITPVAEQEESTYRLGEYVEEVTYSTIRRLGSLGMGGVGVFRPHGSQTNKPGLRVNTISQCANWAIEALARGGSKRNYGGYVPEINKLMTRSIRFDSITGHRYQEQMALPGTFFTHEVVNEALQIMRVSQTSEKLSKVQIRAKQILNTQGEGVLAMAKLLDTLASQASGKRIFLGEEVAQDHPMNYDDIPQQAAARQEKLIDDAWKLVAYIEELDAEGTDPTLALGMVGYFATSLLFDKVKTNPEQAAIVFDDATAETLQKVAKLHSQGNTVAARNLEHVALQEAPTVSFCSPGSCGLEAANIASAEGQRMLKELDVEPGEILIHDTKRACIKCDEVGGVYYNSAKGHKGCAKCGAVEFKK